MVQGFCTSKLALSQRHGSCHGAPKGQAAACNHGRSRCGIPGDNWTEDATQEKEEETQSHKESCNDIVSLI